MNSREDIVRRSRRTFLRRSLQGTLGLAGLSLLGACAPQAPAQPTAAQPQPAATTGAPAPSAPTQAPAVQTGTRTLVVSTWAGSTEQLVRESIIPRFQQETKATVTLDVGAQGARFAKLQAQKGTGSIDVFHCSDELIYTGIKQDLLEPLDDAKIPLVKNLLDWGRPVPGYGPAFATLAFGLAYHTGLVKDPPKKWADLWRPEYSRKLAMPNSSYSMLPSLVIKAAELNGGGLNNLEPGFEELAQLRPAKAFVIFTEWVPLLAQGEVIALADLDVYVYPTRDQGYPIEFVVPEDGVITTINTTNIVKGTKNRDLAHEFINFTLLPEVQIDQARIASYSPSVKNVNVPSDLAGRLAMGERLKGMTVQDGKFASENRPMLAEKFNTVVAPKWAS